jgi:hypothetical protein
MDTASAFEGTRLELFEVLIGHSCFLRDLLYNHRSPIRARGLIKKAISHPTESSYIKTKNQSREDLASAIRKSQTS